MSKKYSSKAIVLARKNYSEADLLLIVLCEKLGKKTLIAKGARKIKSKKRGFLDVFNHVNFAASESRGWGIVTEVEIINSFYEIRNDLKKVSVAYFFIETIGRVVGEDQQNFQVYKLLLKYLNSLKYQKNLKELRLKFIEETLVELGFWPRDKKMPDPDKILENVIDRSMNSKRVGKLILS